MIVQRVSSLNFPSLHASLTYSGLDPWMDFVHEAYGHPIHRFAVFDGEAVLGALALAEIRHPVFGHYMATAPFGSYGGFAFENTAVRDLLLAEARRLGQQAGADYVCVRFDGADSASQPPEGYVADPAYLTYRLDLPASPDELLKRFSSDRRNKIRRSLKKGHRVKFGHLELLDEAYDVIARSMHELGSPYHSKSYLLTMAEHLGGALEFMVVHDASGKPNAAGLLIYQGGVAFMQHGNVLRHARNDRCGEFLDWSAFERSMQKGCSQFDLGRSLVGSGNDVFKSQWLPDRRALAYWYWLAPGRKLPDLNQQNPKYQLAIATWQRLPGLLVRALGPHVIRGLV